MYTQGGIPESHHSPQAARQEIWVRPLGQEDPLQKGMATQSSILAWEIPRTEEPGGLQSVGSQRVRHDGTQTIVLFKLLEKPPYGFPQWLHQSTVHQPCTRVSFPPHPHPNLQVLDDFVILICISLMICNVEHLFNCISSLETMSIKIFCSFFHWVVCYLDIELYETFTYFGY